MEAAILVDGGGKQRGKHKMKSIQVIRRLAFDEWGGTETVVWNSARGLLHKGHEAEIVATAALAQPGRETVDGIDISRFKYFYPLWRLKPESRLELDRKGGNPYSWSMYRYLKTKREAAIFHCHAMHRLADITRRAARKLNIPYVLSFHGENFDISGSELLEMLRPLRHTMDYGRILDWFWRDSRFIADADGIICTGYDEYLSALRRFPGKMVEFLPNGVDIDKFSAAPPQDFREVYHIPPDRMMLLCVSRIDYQKNQRILIEMVRRLLGRHENPHLVLIGPVTSRQYCEQLWRDIAEFGLNDRITLIRGLNVGDPMLTAAYKAADYFILPSLHEPFGIVVLEAWAAGIPVICSGAGGLKRLVAEGGTGIFFNDFSVDDLINKFYVLKNNPELRRCIVENAGEEVRKKYSWDIINQHLLEFYEDIIMTYRLKKGR